MMPSTGPFYFLFLRPKWKLFAHREKPEGDFLGHPKFWVDLVDRVLAPHYGIKAAREIAFLNNLPYAFPRGRVSRTKAGWACYHGADWPMRKVEPRIIKAFGLAAEAKRKCLRFLLDEHEVTLPHDRLRIERVIGAVPGTPKNREDD